MDAGAYSVFQKIIDFFNTTGLSVEKYLLKGGLYEIRAQIIDGPEIRFSLRFDPKNSLDALSTLIQKGNLKNAEYVDLTVENRIYLKPD